MKRAFVITEYTQNDDLPGEWLLGDDIVKRTIEHFNRIPDKRVYIYAKLPCQLLAAIDWTTILLATFIANGWTILDRVTFRSDMGLMNVKLNVECLNCWFVPVLGTKTETFEYYGDVNENNGFYETCNAMDVRYLKVVNDRVDFTKLDTRNLKGFAGKYCDSISQICRTVEQLVLVDVKLGDIGWADELRQNNSLTKLWLSFGHSVSVADAAEIVRRIGPKKLDNWDFSFSRQSHDTDSSYEAFYRLCRLYYGEMSYVLLALLDDVFDRDVLSTIFKFVE